MSRSREAEDSSMLGNYDAVARRAMESLFRTFENFSEGTIVVDTNARVVWINKRYAARFGFEDAQAAIGLECEKVIPNSLMRQVVKTGKPILLDILETPQDPMIVMRLPIKDNDGNTIGAVGFALFDELKSLTPLFTHYTRVREELMATRRTLEQTRRAKYTFASFVGNCPATLEVKRMARRAAQADAPVLLLGETGTGKELLAHAIHAASARAGRPLVTLNMAAIPETLLEVEFFGAAPGAYTGAERKGRMGKFELADGGTLFLDEIGDMPLMLQSKLLRALQEKEIEPIGSNRIIRSDVRIIAATSADLPALVEAGKFRADLYYRLNVLPICLPPLRQRQPDLLPLVYAMLEEICTRAERDAPALTQAALQMLVQYDWPGNVRQLRNILERLVMMHDTGEVDDSTLASLLGLRVVQDPGSLPAQPAAPEALIQPPPELGYAEAMAQFEAAYLVRALAASSGHVARAAASIGISRAALYKKLVAHRNAGRLPGRGVWNLNG
ncbi:sigma-54 interaction domain-containing protein [Cupriavidus consociatus]|uniref:sigma-54 interaction domain-containing protein n=1 Tax=Cupriavidus consociatus TaxID=2821357 RepID=UPI001AE45785|nr:MULTISPECIES: sigma 54-interacting transcriptional regulator [unclassified Cupriavidus]MBP0624110.1 sigma 54-interacting transcriptional regulator [Cupriavidus sp. LEh25]MDK2660821.1 sigma 54-interacting transcriptional regulator [Cupriavidus sp. LEh21]